MSEPANDPHDSRALMRAYLQRRRAVGALGAADFLEGRPAVDDALRAWLQVAEAWSEGEIEERLKKLDDESAAERDGRTLALDATEEIERTLPITPQDTGAERHFDGRYRVLEAIGEGGCGKVFLVEDMLHNHERLALKVVRSDLADTAQFEQRFRNEIRVLRALSHPMIPQIFNDGKTPEGDIYYTMSFVPGTSLADILEHDAPLEASRVVSLVRQVIEVLDYAHSKGVVHRDLKPSNILVLDAGTPQEEVRVLDFGIAKILAREGALENAQTMQTAAMLGTPHYMSPEQVSGQTIDPSTDIYALGVIVYQMCSGKLPFTGKAMMELLTARLRHKAPQLSDEQIPIWLRRLVSRLLEMEGKKRPSTREIQAIFAHGMHEGRKSAHRSVGLAAAVTVLVAAGLYAALGGGGDDAQEEEGPGARLDPGASVTAPATALTEDLAEGPGEDQDQSTQAGEADTPLPAEELDTAEPGPGENAVAVPTPGDEAQEPEASAPVLEGVEWDTPEAGLVTNAHVLSVSGTCSPPADFDLAIGLAEEAQRSMGPAQADGSFERRLSLPLADGRYTLVVEHAGERVAQRTLRVDRTPPRALEGARLTAGGPFAHEDGPIRVQFRFDEAVTLRTEDGQACGELDSGSGEARVPLPAVDSAQPQQLELTLVAADRLGNEGTLRIPVEVYSRTLVQLAESGSDDKGSFTFTSGAAAFPPPVGFDLTTGRFLIPAPGGSTRVFELPRGARLVEYLGQHVPALVFRVDSGREVTEMVLVCGAENPRLTDEPFLLDRHEVSWARYEPFVQANSADRPSYKDFHPNLADQVVVGVQWEDADAFARWAGKRLPSAAQWETAAGWDGSSLRKFPWGGAFHPAAVGLRKLHEPVYLADLEADVSPWGVLGMGGGAREWVGDLPASRSRRIARGGTSYVPLPFGFTLEDDYTQSPSTYDSAYGVTTAEKTPRLLDTPANLKDVGLRCVMPLERAR